MAYWLLKTEPGNYSWDDLLRDKGTFWDGVRNYQARNNMREMKKGDLCFIYHSVGPKEIVGIARVTKEAYQDPTTDDDAWVCVDIKPVKRLKTAVHLSDIKADKLLSQMALVKNSRLSVSPVSKKEWDKAVKAGGA
jgi:predicted RNA-binding protein with PUA-like domain